MNPEAAPPHTPPPRPPPAGVWWREDCGDHPGWVRRCNEEVVVWMVLLISYHHGRLRLSNLSGAAAPPPSHCAVFGLASERTVCTVHADTPPAKSFVHTRKWAVSGAGSRPPRWRGTRERQWGHWHQQLLSSSVEEEKNTNDSSAVPLSPRPPRQTLCVTCCGQSLGGGPGRGKSPPGRGGREGTSRYVHAGPKFGGSWRHESRAP